MKINLRGREFEVMEHGVEAFDWLNTIGWEKPTFDAMDRLTPETTFIDIGAWIGSMTLHAKDKCKRILSIEPDPVAFAVLEQNVTLNGVSAELHPIAISDHDGTVRLGSGLLGASTTRVNSSDVNGIGGWVDGQIIDAPCSSLSSFVARNQVEDPIFIKMDVEGSEEMILRNSLGWIREHQPALVVELHPFWWRYPQYMAKTLTELKSFYSSINTTADWLFLHA